jgi:hypothetical protein
LKRSKKNKDKDKEKDKDKGKDKNKDKDGKGDERSMRACGGAEWGERSSRNKS